MRYIIFISLFLCSIILSSIVLYTVSNLNNIVVASNVLNDEEELPSQKKSNSNTLNLSEEEHHFVFNILKVNFFTYRNEIKMGDLIKKIKLVFVEIITPPPLW
ncbi:MAG: hypothetical protein HYU68_12105 [Bacteroidetes bacterium]|nr:hypothetical protein [Bacteroidota bacterium]